jgi:ATP-dependent DNA ligase
MQPLTEAEARAIWAVLVEHAGASKGQQAADAFAWYQGDQVCTEYRFQGSLGFGGKFRRNSHSLREDRYVDCYSEDLTMERAEMIDRTNAALKALR